MTDAIIAIMAQTPYVPFHTFIPCSSIFFIFLALVGTADMEWLAKLEDELPPLVGAQPATKAKARTLSIPAALPVPKRPRLSSSEAVSVKTKTAGGPAWVNLLDRILKPFFEQKRQKKSLKLQSLCTGLCTEAYALQETLPP